MIFQGFRALSDEHIPVAVVAVLIQFGVNRLWTEGPTGHTTARRITTLPIDLQTATALGIEVLPALLTACFPTGPLA